MPHQPIPPRNRGFARQMRREPTEAENLLWGALRGRRLDRIKFRRQVPVGAYIADFVCAEEMLIVEIDGSQHADSSHDRERDAALKSRGFRVLRFWNDEVLHELNSVCDTIIAMLGIGVCSRGAEAPHSVQHPSSDLASLGHLLPQGEKGETRFIASQRG